MRTLSRRRLTESAILHRRYTTRDRFGAAVVTETTETVRVATSPGGEGESFDIHKDVKLGTGERIFWLTETAVASSVDLDSEGRGRPGDIIEYQGIEYTIFSVRDWGRFRECHGRSNALTGG